MLGGAIVTYVSWRWIFWINVPIGVGAVLLATRVLRDRGERAHRHLDLAGMAFMVLAAALSAMRARPAHAHPAVTR